ncbi:MAG TPA: formate/nitrite transporter family protein [Candidatus Didemnitutus sp.]|nr:formate/nitrite transporter family protein [Candidatus Didemnitutus sp.]
MDYIKPAEVVKSMVSVGETKAALGLRDLLIRGALSGALLGISTSLALTAAAQTNTPLVGALVFPVGFVMIVLLGLELVTGSFAVVPLAAVDGRTSWGQVISNLFWVFVGNLLGSVAFGALLYIALGGLTGGAPTGIAAKMVSIAEAKTTAYAALGTVGLITVFVKAILCNWMVCFGVVMGLTSQSMLGKLVGAWLPIVVFFAQGFEHSVVNMFVIPTGMMFGAKVSVSDWWLWNQLPVTLGNLVGGLFFTGLAMYGTYRPKAPAAAPAPAIAASEPVRA